MPTTGPSCPNPRVRGRESPESRSPRPTPQTAWASRDAAADRPAREKPADPSPRPVVSSVPGMTAPGRPLADVVRTSRPSTAGTPRSARSAHVPSVVLQHACLPIHVSLYLILVSTAAPNIPRSRSHRDGRTIDYAVSRPTHRGRSPSRRRVAEMCRSRVSRVARRKCGIRQPIRAVERHRRMPPAVVSGRVRCLTGVERARWVGRSVMRGDRRRRSSTMIDRR